MMNVRLSWQFVVALCFVARISSAAELLKSSDNDSPTSSAARQLVVEALRAEEQGDVAEREKLLNQALETAPDDPAPRWHSGQVRQGDDWVPLDQAQRKNQRDPRLAGYRKLRSTTRDTVQDHLALADFCHKNNLPEERRSHLVRVLELDPQNRAAIEGLGLRRHQGRLMPVDQIQQLEQRAAQAAASTKKWKRELAILKREASSRDPATREVALQKLRDLDDPAAIPLIEAIFSKNSRRLALDVVEVLGTKPGQEATESLLRHAILSRWEEVRIAAADELKRRPLPNYVPILLSGLAAPLEADLDISTDPDRIQVRQTVNRQREIDELSLVTDRNIEFPDLQPGQQYNMAGIDQVFRGAMQSAALVENAVQKANRRTTISNDRIYSVLRHVTGADLGTRPADWWDWWHNYNDIYTSSERSPQVTYASYNYYVPRYDAPAYPPPRPTIGLGSPKSYAYFQGPFSCFAKGTKVWTATGQVPIEEVQVGDRVLSQDPVSGELAFKPVLKTTVRPPRPMLHLHIGGETIISTRGHLLWVAGSGWQMAQELQPGMRLHQPTGSVEVNRVEEMEPEVAYNLIVADFNSYFIGESCVLVHDNTPRGPTTTTLPGLPLEPDKLTAK